jgi:hypothetical protein
MPEYSDIMAEQFAGEHLRFLTETNPKFLASLKKSGDLESYLHSVGEAASEMYGTIMAQGSQTKEMQELPFQQTLDALNGLQQAAREIVQHDLIFQPIPN